MDEETAISSPTRVPFFRRTYVFSTNNISPRLRILTTSFEQSIIFAVPALLAFLQLACQGGGSAFKTHPKTMGLAVCATVVFFLAFSGQLTFPVGGVSVARHCMVWSGNAAVASLASVFAPDSLRPLIYAAAVLASASEVVRWLYNYILDGIRETYHRIIRKIVLYVRRILTSWALGGEMMLPTSQRDLGPHRDAK